MWTPSPSGIRLTLHSDHSSFHRPAAILIAFSMWCSNQTPSYVCSSGNRSRSDHQTVWYDCQQRINSKAETKRNTHSITVQCLSSKMATSCLIAVWPWPICSYGCKWQNGDCHTTWENDYQTYFLQYFKLVTLDYSNTTGNNTGNHNIVIDIDSPNPPVQHNYCNTPNCISRVRSPPVYLNDYVLTLRDPNGKDSGKDEILVTSLSLA